MRDGRLHSPQGTPGASCPLAAALHYRNTSTLAALLNHGECAAAPWPGAAGKTAWHAAAGPDGIQRLLRELITDGRQGRGADHERLKLRQALPLVDDVRRTPLHYAAMGSDGNRMSLLIGRFCLPKK